MTPVYKLSNAGGFTSKQRYTSMLAGNAAYEPVSFESIATTIVGSGGSSSIAFTSIPTTYTHLQIRILNKIAAGGINPTMRFNNDNGTNYITHQLYGDGSSVGSFSFGSGTSIGLSYTTTQWGAQIIDILDYTSTNKNKTVKTLGGTDTNGGGYTNLTSGLWYNSTIAAINKIEIFSASTTFSEYSYFALYGIKAA